MNGGQDQDGWRATMLRPHQGWPNLGQPGAPLTAVDSAASLPSRLSGVRYSPCTCSPMEAARHQTREETPAVQSMRVSIDIPPLHPGDDRRPIQQNLHELLYTYHNPPVKHRACGLTCG